MGAYSNYRAQTENALFESLKLGTTQQELQLSQRVSSGFSAFVMDTQARSTLLSQLLEQVLMQSYRQYLKADQWACVAAIESLWGKYAVTATQLEAVRAQAEFELSSFLLELGYE